MPIASTVAITRPENTRAVVAPTVIITDSKGVGPLFIAVPMVQRVAVLKNLACSGEVAEEDVRRRQQLGIGPAERPAQLPQAGEQRDGQAGPPDLGQRVETRHRGEQAGYRRRAGCSGGGAHIAVASDDGHQADLYLSLP